MKRKMGKNVGAAFALVETRHAEGTLGNGRAVYDLRSLSVYASAWLEGDSVDMSTLPKVMAHRKRMSERPAVLKVLAEEKN